MDGMGCDAMRGDAMGCDAMGWDAMGWNGMQCAGMGCNNDENEWIYEKSDSASGQKMRFQRARRKKVHLLLKDCLWI